METKFIDKYNKCLFRDLIYEMLIGYDVILFDYKNALINLFDYDCKEINTISKYFNLKNAFLYYESYLLFCNEGKKNRPIDMYYIDKIEKYKYVSFLCQSYLIRKTYVFEILKIFNCIGWGVSKTSIVTFIDSEINKSERYKILNKKLPHDITSNIISYLSLI